MLKDAYDSNKYEHDYVLGMLNNFLADYKLLGYSPQLMDKTAVQFTAFMHGEIAHYLRGEI